jgi:hypothetical protein
MTDPKVGNVTFGPWRPIDPEEIGKQFSLPPSATGPWQPISQAPKDGTQILLEWNGGASYSVGFWDIDADEKSGWVLEGFEHYLPDSNFQRFALIKP